MKKELFIKNTSLPGSSIQRWELILISEEPDRKNQIYHILRNI